MVEDADDVFVRLELIQQILVSQESYKTKTNPKKMEAAEIVNYISKVHAHQKAL